MMRELAHLCRIALKVFSFGVFGLGAFVIGGLMYPLLLFVFVFRDRRCLRIALRRVVSLSFAFFIWMLGFFDLVHVELSDEDKKRLRDLRACIVCANHPSLIDVVILISKIPQADCIVRGNLFSMPAVRLVARRLYIPNSLSFDETVERCAASLAEGNNLIVFPEGTRTRIKEGRGPVFRRGASHIALRTRRALQPVHIWTDGECGLRKGDPLFSFRRGGPLRYRISVGAPLHPGPDVDLPEPRAARALTKRLADAIKSC